MNPADDLLRLLAGWRELTEREGEAIARADWPAVTRQQDLKAELRLRLTPAFAALQSAIPETADAAGKQDGALDLVVSELVALETRNRDLLRSRRTARKAELDRVNATVANLRQLRRAYDQGPSSLWQSYS
jgi:hypothetical protein